MNIHHHFSVPITTDERTTINMNHLSTDAIAALITVLVLGTLQLVFTILTWWETQRFARHSEYAPTRHISGSN